MSGAKVEVVEAEELTEPEVRPAKPRAEIDYSLTPSNLEYMIRNLKLSIAAGENADPHSTPLSGGIVEGRYVGTNPGALISPSTDLIGDRKRLVKLIQQRENWDTVVRPKWQAALDEAYEKRQILINHARELVDEMPQAYRMDDGFVSLIESWCETLLAIQKIDQAMKHPARQLGQPWNVKILRWPFGGRMNREDLELLKNARAMANTIGGYLETKAFPSDGRGRGQKSTWAPNVQSEGVS